ncbi:MAG: tRNA pseudouridine(38-40) synthase TruA [Neisseria sp.]|uniref:tRNA pseudouridine(38-40) synthase TruA n=1 Tax=Neisseria sp. TaxID=192066 RepID=UPI0026DB269A|nr:tRNA pseudouridine(38-40) synthase TruA [Neisseria sp.]MDO4642127.1 tRNA pseudouridine(38-40) synthase TruA [Neisseria sp.]
MEKQQRWLLILSYDGSRFFGWQKQTSDVLTVQAVLEDALSRIAGESINVVAAGRTDTGVHATGQVVHFDTTAIRSEQAWIRGVNAYLPEGVAVLCAKRAHPRFHARFDASGRRYRYVLQSSAVRSPLLIGKAGWTHRALDIVLMQTAAACLEGEHDFSSFRASQCQAKSPIKTLYSIRLSGTPSLMALDLHGNAFLHHMVRNIMGALVYVGCGKLSVQDFSDLLVEKSRLKAPPTFMPDGLYLTGVDYPEHWGVEAPLVPDWLWSP